MSSPFKVGRFGKLAAGLLGDPSRCRNMGLDAFFLGKKRFTMERMARDYERLYQQD